MTYKDMRDEARAAELRVERRKLLAVLRRNRWSAQLAADELEISASTLYRALERHPDLRIDLYRKSPPPGPKKRVRI